MSDLEKARQIINKVDAEMAKLFEERMDAVKMVAAYKKQHGLQIEDIKREELVIQKNAELLKNEELRSYFVNFLQSNMDISKAYQHKLLEGMHVAFSGVEGAFANIAANKIFPDAVAVPHPDFKAAYNSVVNGACECVILPIENSYNGDVGQVMDLTFFGPLYINGVYDISIVQNLLAVKGATVDTIKQVISHPQALGQCAGYIKKHNFETVEAVNTAVAAQMVAEGNDKSIAAIASVETAELYGLKVLDHDINESSGNTTRFAVFSRIPRDNTPDQNNFIVLFTVRDEAGSLGKAISVFGECGYNLKALKSRPSKDVIWNYYFFLEGEGHLTEEAEKSMLDKLSEVCTNVRLVGRYSKEQSI